MLLHLASLFLLAFAVSLDGFGVGITYGLRQIRIPVFSIVIICCCSGLVILLAMLAGSWLAGYLSPEAASIIGAVILMGIGGWAIFQFWQGQRVKTQEAKHKAANRSAESPDSLGVAARASAEAVHSAEQQSTSQVEHTVPDAAEPSATALFVVELKRMGLVIKILRTPQAADVDRSGTISSSEALLLGAALSLDAFGAGLGAALIGYPPLLTAALIAVSSGVFLMLGLRTGFQFSASPRMRTLSVLPGLILIVMGIIKLL
ncbi:sporulation membrane protein YtaF [Paenibacillaceae bacterium]|nr:sporulation membrane protein YtaF [Paenibacillaceae bacterium]